MLGVGLLGILVGFSSALLGLGGSIFIIPILPELMTISLKETVATSIFSVMFITLINVYRFHQSKLIDYKLAIKLIPLTLIASYLGSNLAQDVSDIIIKFLLIFVIFLMIIKLLFFAHKEVLLNDKQQNIVLITISLFSGVVAGMTGIGSGVILGPALLTFNLIDQKKMSPTINLMIFIACFGASLGYIDFSNITLLKSGFIHLDLALILILCSLIGSYIGRRINFSISDGRRKKLMAVMLMSVWLKMALSI